MLRYSLRQLSNPWLSNSVPQSPLFLSRRPLSSNPFRRRSSLDELRNLIHDAERGSPSARETLNQLLQSKPSNFSSNNVSKSQSQSDFTNSTPRPPPLPEQRLGTQDEPLTVVIAQSKSGKFISLLRALMPISVALALYFGILSIENGIKSMSGESRYKDSSSNNGVPRVKFSDVKGCDEAKAELEEIVAYLKNPSQFNQLGGKMPKGVLLTGEPGSGKTLLARAIAGEAGVPFFACSGSEFEEMFVGLGAKRIRELFAVARKHTPAIIFIDELDAVGGKRGPREMQATRQTLNQLLVELDGFDNSQPIICIGATNLPQALDPALTRPGRFDSRINVPLPDVRGRKEILELYASKIPLSSDVDLSVLARGTPGCSGAQLANLINSAALRAAKLNKKFVDMNELEYAKDKILMGSERSHYMSEKDKLLTAYHEGGHTLVALLTKAALPLHKVTILPRGQSLGTTHLLPDNDLISMSRRQLLAQLDVAMGGRVAEEFVYGTDNVTTGASNDLEHATSIARQMVMNYGMSDKIGLMIIGNDSSDGVYSSEIRSAVDEEVNKLINESYERAKKLIKSNESKLHLLAKALVKYETLDSKQIQKLFQKYEETIQKQKQQKQNEFSVSDEISVETSNSITNKKRQTSDDLSSGLPPSLSQPITTVIEQNT